VGVGVGVGEVVGLVVGVGVGLPVGVGVPVVGWTVPLNSVLPRRTRTLFVPLERLDGIVTPTGIVVPFFT
jgi:hypothetical protein